MEIGWVKFNQPIIIYEAERPELLLGNEVFLDRFNNYGCRYLRPIAKFKNKNSPVVTIKYHTNRKKVRSLTEVTIEPNSTIEVVISLVSDDERLPIGQELVIESDEKITTGLPIGTIIHDSISRVDVDQTLKVQVSNVSAEPIILPARSIIGDVVYLTQNKSEPVESSDVYSLLDLQDETDRDMFVRMVKTSRNEETAEMHDLDGEHEILHGATDGVTPPPPGYESKPKKKIDLETSLNLNHLTKEQQEALKRIIFKHRKAFASTETSIGTTDVITHKIDVDGVKPIAQAYRPVPKMYEQEVAKMIKELLDIGVICEAKQSPWASNLVIVKKKNTGKLRICCDLRGPNSVSKNRNKWPIRNVEVSFSKLAKAKYVTALDLQSAYWTIRMDEESSKVTAFYGPHAKHYQWIRMPFGLAGAPHTYCQAMSRILSGTEQFSFAYFDDIIIFSDSFQDHLKHIDEVIGRFERAGFIIAPHKCNWACSEKMPFKWLGTVVKHGHIYPEKEKIEAINQLEPPKTRKQMMSFLGAVSFHRRHIKGFAEITAPLFELTKPKRDYVWTETHEKAFKAIKKALMEAPALALPDTEKPFILSSDASGTAIGCTLSQIREDGNEVICAYASRKLTDLEALHMSMPEKELAAILYGCKTWAYYLTHNHFTIRTDARSLIFCKKYQNVNSKIGRIALWLSELTFDIQHVSRKDGNTIAICDHLSRSFKEKPFMVTYKALRNPKLNKLPEPNFKGKMSAEEFDEYANAYIKEHLSDEPSDKISKIEFQEPLELQSNVSIKDRYLDCLDYTNKLPTINRITSCAKLLDGSLEANVMNVAISDACMTKEDFIKLQEEDEELKPIISKVKVDNLQVDGYFVKRGVLMRTHNDMPVVVVPKPLQKNLIAYFHGTMVGSHAGSVKIARSLANRFYWKGMHEQVKDYCEKCIICQFNKPSSRGKIGLGISKTPTKPNQLVAVDCITGLPYSSERHKVIVVFLDTFTKFCVAVPLRDKTTSAVCKAFMQYWVPIFGIPAQLHSDEGETDSKLVVELCHMLGIKKSHTPTYHPASNGACEAVNKTIGNMIRTALPEHGVKAWHRILPFLMNAYNNLPHTQTGYSPAELTFGHEISNHIVPIFPVDHPAITHHDYLKDLRIGQEVNWQIVHEKLQLDKEKRSGNSAQRSSPYEIGDFVLLKDKTPKVAKTVDQIGTKLLPVYKGPYRVIKVWPHALHIVRWEDAAEAQEALDDPAKFRMHHQGKVTIIETILVHPDDCKPFKGEVKRYPIFNRTVARKFLKDLGVLDQDPETLDPEETPDPCYPGYLQQDKELVEYFEKENRRQSTGYDFYSSGNRGNNDDGNDDDDDDDHRPDAGAQPPPASPGGEEGDAQNSNRDTQNSNFDQEPPAQDSNRMIPDQLTEDQPHTDQAEPAEELDQEGNTGTQTPEPIDDSAFAQMPGQSIAGPSYMWDSAILHNQPGDTESIPEEKSALESSDIDIDVGERTFTVPDPSLVLDPSIVFGRKDKLIRTPPRTEPLPIQEEPSALSADLEPPKERPKPIPPKLVFISDEETTPIATRVADPFRRSGLPRTPTQPKPAEVIPHGASALESQKESSLVHMPMTKPIMNPGTIKQKPTSASGTNQPVTQLEPPQSSVRAHASRRGFMQTSLNNPLQFTETEIGPPLRRSTLAAEATSQKPPKPSTSMEGPVITSFPGMPKTIQRRGLGTSEDNPLALPQQPVSGTGQTSSLFGRKELIDPDYKPPPHVKLQPLAEPKKSVRKKKKEEGMVRF